MRAASVL